MVPRAPRLLGLYAVIGGLVSFLGWPFDLRRLTDWINSGISTQPNTALAAMCGGLAVLMLSRHHRRATTVLAAVVGVIGGATLLQYIFGVSFGIDGLLVTTKNCPDPP